MSEYLSCSTKVLLEMFGAGKPVPGSGSAAALNALLSCSLIQTVTQLTLRKQFNEVVKGRCHQIQSEINLRIRPRLEYLFQADADHFDLVIKKRKERDEAPNELLKKRRSQEVLKLLKVSTSYPIEIAQLSVDLAEYSLFIFDNCWKTVRGDSGVALSSAMSSLSGCISIASLNLQAFTDDLWTKGVLDKIQALRGSYRRFNYESNVRHEVLGEEVKLLNELKDNINRIKGRLFGKENISHAEIEELATELQRVLWRKRELIWPNKVVLEPTMVLSPQKAIGLLGYGYRKMETLGVNENNVEIAGILNHREKEVYISEKFDQPVRRFTTAHELGHILLHDFPVLHRDIPLDGGNVPADRSVEELQADKFSTFFLMPAKHVIKVFKDLFGIEYFLLSEDMAFALERCSLGELRRRSRNRRGLSRIVASAKHFNDDSFRSSISEVFKVSTEAMAIRLEELELVKF